MAKRGGGKTTEAVRVGVTRTGKFGSRVGGVAGRTETGGRSGLTDAAVSAGSKAHGRSAPGTGVGGYGGGSGGGGVVETTTNPGGYDYGDPYADPGEGGGSDPIFEDPGDPTPSPSVTPITKAPPSVTRTPAPTAPRTTTPAPRTTTPAPRTTTPAPRTTTPAPRSTSTPFVTPIGGQQPYYTAPKTTTTTTPKPKPIVTVASKSTAGRPQPKVVVQPKVTKAAPEKKKVASSTRLVAK